MHNSGAVRDLTVILARRLARAKYRQTHAPDTSSFEVSVPCDLVERL